MRSFNKFKFTAIAGAILSANAFAANEIGGELDEVLITAQKRVQSAQDVPVSVTAFSNEKLQELGVTDVFDLQTSVPSLQVTSAQSATTSAFSIRGVGTSGQNFGLESSVGLYVDGVYRSRQSSTINELIDIEAVEVLRGPQGTLFGRNTPSGAIQIKSVAPKEQADGFVSITAGDYGLVSASAAAGGPIGKSKWSYRATVFTSQRDGFVSDENLGEDVINDRDRQGARVQLQYQPNENFSARLIADYSEIDEVCCAAVTERNNRIGAGGQAGSDTLLTAFGGNLISEERLFDDVTALNTLPVSQNEDTGVSLELKFGQESDGQITSITAVRNFMEYFAFDADFTDVDLFTRTEEAETQSFSQELRYAKSSDYSNFVVGAYYFDQTIDSRRATTTGAFVTPFLSQDPDLGTLINTARAFGLPVADPVPLNSGANDFFEQDHRSTAIFGQFDFRLSEALSASLGLRYTDEEKTVNGIFTQDDTGPAVDLDAIRSGDFRSVAGLAFPGWGFTIGGPLAIVGVRDNVQAEVNDSQTTGTFKLGYKANKNSLFYAAYSTGFKSGGTNTDRIDPQFDSTFDAETSASFEIGIKRDFPDQALRVNLSLHNTVTEDFQTVAFTGQGFNLTNAGELETRGGELEVLWYPTDTLSISTSLVYNEGEFTSFTGAPCWTVSPFLTGLDAPSNENGICDLSGSDLSFNPERMFQFSLDKQFLLWDNDAFLHADFSYRSESFQDGDIDPLKVQEAYSLLNLKAGILLGNGDTELSLWVRNALDEDYLGIRFSPPLQLGKLNAYAQEPRTIGVTARRKF